MTDPFNPKFYSLIQNNSVLKIADGLNFVMCEQTLCNNDSFLRMRMCKESEGQPYKVISGNGNGSHGGPLTK